MATTCTTTISSNLSDFPDILPVELILPIFQCLSDTDLYHLALCNRRLREVTNNNNLWRGLCERNGWERYGTVMDLTKMVPYVPHISQETDARSVGSSKVSFQLDSVIGEQMPGLVATCQWKETYMRAHHLESNWEKGRFHTAHYKTQQEQGKCGASYSRPPPQRSSVNRKITGCDVDGDCVVVALSETIQVWDVKKNVCQHVIPMEGPKARYHGRPFKVKSGIIVVGGRGGVIHTFSTQTGEALREMIGHHTENAIVTRIFFDGETVVSTLLTSAGEYTHVWSVADGVLRHILMRGPEGTSITRLIEVDYRDKTVAAACSDNCLRVWDTNSGVCVHTLKPSEPDIPEIALTSCALGDCIVASPLRVRLEDGGFLKFVMKIWSTTSGECIKSFEIGLGLPSIAFDKNSSCSVQIQNNLLNLHVYMYDSETCRCTQPSCKAACLLFYTQTGDLVQHFPLSPFGDSKNLCHFHGNKVVVVNEAQQDPAGLLDYYHIYKVTNNSFKHANSSIEALNKGGRLNYGVVLDMDDTKICFADRNGEVLYICHYW